MGPWVINKVRGPVNYRIVRTNHKKKKERLLVHHDRLKPYHSRPECLEGESDKVESEVEVLPGDGAGSNRESGEGLTNPSPESDDDEYDEAQEGLEEDEQYESATSDQEEEEEIQEEESEESEDGELENHDHNQKVTRSGRVVKPNRRYCCSVWKGGGHN